MWGFAYALSFPLALSLLSLSSLSHTLSHPHSLSHTPGSSLVNLLSLWGLAPRMDVLPLSEINIEYPVIERTNLPPKVITRVSLSDLLGELEEEKILHACMCV